MDINSKEHDKKYKNTKQNIIKSAKHNSLPVTAQNNAGKVYSQWLFIQSIYLSQQIYLPWSQKFSDVERIIDRSVDREESKSLCVEI